jgi:hypothetical protein
VAKAHELQDLQAVKAQEIVGLQEVLQAREEELQAHEEELQDHEEELQD